MIADIIASFLPNCWPEGSGLELHGENVNVVAYCCHAPNSASLLVGQPPIVGPNLSTLPLATKLDDGWLEGRLSHADALVAVL